MPVERRLVKQPAVDYTFFMLLAYSIVLCSLFAQADPDFPGKEPYVFVMRAEDGTTERLYVLVDPEELAKIHRPFLSAYRDEPWLAIDQRHERIRRENLVDSYPHASSLRKQWLREGWEEHRDVEVDTPDGKKWVFKEDYDYAQRATSLAKAAYSTHASFTQPAPGAAVDEELNPLEFWEQWWLHGVIVLAAIVLGAGVIWVTMLRGPWTSLRS